MLASAGRAHGSTIIEAALVLPVLALLAWGGLRVAALAVTGVRTQATAHELGVLRFGDGADVQRRRVQHALPGQRCVAQARGYTCGASAGVALAVHLNVATQRVDAAACQDARCLQRRFTAHRLRLR